jgi:hypothetical protein
VLQLLTCTNYVIE